MSPIRPQRSSPNRRPSHVRPRRRHTPSVRSRRRPPSTRSSWLWRPSRYSQSTQWCPSASRTIRAAPRRRCGPRSTGTARRMERESPRGREEVPSAAAPPCTRRNPKATHRSPTAMSADPVGRPVSGLTRACIMQANRLPASFQDAVALRFVTTRLPLRGQCRV